MDIPLFLTDYLIARTQDITYIKNMGIQGQLTLSSGQELGTWLFDWNVALQNLQEYKNDPYAALILLGENKATWERILKFQNTYFKNLGLLSIISSATIFDELPFQTPAHQRILFRDFNRKETFVRADLQLLEKAIKEIPSIDEVKTEELKLLLNLTHLRLQHAYALRMAVVSQHQREQYTSWFAKAQTIRVNATKIMEQVIKKYNRYADLKLFENYESPTSYDFGYGLTAKTLSYWKREEDMVDDHVINPFHANVYNLFEYLF